MENPCARDALLLFLIDDILSVVKCRYTMTK